MDKITKKFNRINAVKLKVGLSRSSIYLMMASGTFPKSISIGLRSIAWLDSDIDDWMDSRIAISKAV